MIQVGPSNILLRGHLRQGIPVTAERRAILQIFNDDLLAGDVAAKTVLSDTGSESP